MSDIPQAPDWWQASDGKWYPPQAGQAAPDPFTQMQQGTTAPPAAPNPFGGQMVYDASATGKGCMSLGMIITIVTLLIGGAITAVVLFAVKDASDTIDETFDTENEAIDSVEVTDCGRAEDRLNSASANLDVTNDGDDTATYFIEITFESRNGNRQFGTGNATVTGLQAGNTTSIETGGIIEVPEGQRFSCRVTSVDRIQTG
jgi:hypothetical protein